jgi:N-acetyl-alpha-D-muramate 1-phosphate uridylyltransferase
MTWRPKAAMVLAAGLGRRMRPLTDLLPKPLVRLKGTPLIDHVLDRIAAAGIPHAVVNVHFGADALEAHLRPRERPRITISNERRRLLDTGGGVKKALSKLGDEPFLIHNSDSIWIEGVGANLERLSRAFHAAWMDSLMLVAAGSESLGYEGCGDFVMSPDGRLRRPAERELAPFVFTGVSIAHPRLFVGAPDGSFSLNLLWDRAIDAGRLYGLRLDGLWMHVGSPEALMQAERLIGADEGN